MYYRFDKIEGNQYVYKVTLKLYRDCYSEGAFFDPTAVIGIFENGTNRMVRSVTVDLSDTARMDLRSPGPCVRNAPVVCYQAGFYEATISLPASTTGYTLAYQRCCRIAGINNLNNSGDQGATYTATIPGTSPIASAPANHSARFRGVDTVIVCARYSFKYSFAADDADGDVLRYRFCAAYRGGGQANGSGPNSPAPNPPSGPPYQNTSYRSRFSGGSPLGPDVTIDPNTGLISGKAPEQGIYVVTVCVDEIRNGVVIATQRKDLQIKAGGCDIAEPSLEPEYRSCDGFTFDFFHPNNPLITSYNWEFGDPASGANNYSTLQNPSHTFTTAATFSIKLVANRGDECSDSATSIIRVFPGFFPAFSSAGVCINNPTQFTDATTSRYGFIDKWEWDFGEQGTRDTSTRQHPVYQYNNGGSKNVRLIVGSSVGCLDTIYRQVDMVDRPPIDLAFKDTLICIPDVVQLQATGTGDFSWSPATAIVNENTGTPTVNPTTTTKYYVNLDLEGCVNKDSVLVQVVDGVTLQAMSDTSICLTDPVQLTVNSDGLKFNWTPASTLSNATVKNPVALPSATTTYQVEARIGSCSATDNVVITTIPYPVARLGQDTTICYNTPVQLSATHDGSSFSWSPVESLLNANTLTPTGYPARSQEYIFSSYDTRGCPKPGRDTILVTLLPPIIPSATADTMVVVGQPVQLNAHGGIRYQWIPAVGLNDPNIKNPVGIYNRAGDSITYTVRIYNEADCYDSAFVKVSVFNVNPTVFVPTAFTPNGDGLNDILRPVAVGVERINYFRVYNRWGQLVFHTTTNGAGWDGRINGSPQGANVFVWMVSAIDYRGNNIFLKGTATLVR